MRLVGIPLQLLWANAQHVRAQVKPVGAKPEPAGYTSQNAGDKGQMRGGSRVPLEGGIQISGDTGGTLWGHQSNFCVLMPNV